MGLQKKERAKPTLKEDFTIRKKPMKKIVKQLVQLKSGKKEKRKKDRKKEKLVMRKKN